MKHILVILVLVGISLGACEKEKVNNEYKSTDDLLFETELKINNSSKDEPIIVIDLWRKSRNCLGGLGICAVRIGDWTIYKNGENDSPSRTISSNIVEENNKKYIYLKLANSPEGFSSNELKFHVEEEFFVENKDTKITVPASTYDYEPAIGSHGGYKINVK